MAENVTKDTKKKSNKPFVPFQERVNRKIEMLTKMVETNPNTTHVVTTELQESHDVYSLINEIEEGMKNLKLSMFTPKLNEKDGAYAIQYFNWAKTQLSEAVKNINSLGFGQRYTVSKIRENDQKHNNRMKRLADSSPELKSVVKEYEALLATQVKAKIDLINKRMEEDKKMDEENASKIEELHKTFKDKEYKIFEDEKQKQKQQKEAKLKSREDHIKLVRELKAKIKETKGQAHTQRMKNVQLAKTVRTKTEALTLANEALELAETALNDAKETNDETKISSAQEEYNNVSTELNKAKTQLIEQETAHKNGLATLSPLEEEVQKLELEVKQAHDSQKK